MTIREGCWEEATGAGLGILSIPEDQDEQSPMRKLRRGNWGSAGPSWSHVGTEGQERLGSRTHQRVRRLADLEEVWGEGAVRSEVGGGFPICPRPRAV